MSINSLDRELLSFWTNITFLSKEESVDIIYTFSSDYVKDLFVKKFIKEFNGYKPINDRFFNKCKKVSLDYIFNKRNILADISMIRRNSHFYGYHFIGKNNILSKIFLDTQDSLIRIDLKGDISYYFFSSHLEVIYKF